jgi:hypothetical protein
VRSSLTTYYIKQLEKDITKDAIKNKQFELYN